MDLTGYKIIPVTPFETASNYTTIITSSNTAAGTATTKLDFPSGTYNLAVNCFDLIGGRVHWEVFPNDHALGAWTGNHQDTLGNAVSANLDGHTASRVTFKGAKIEKGDTLKIMGTPLGTEQAPLEYVALPPPGVV
jgi:alpha-glucuronidase